eukprot:3327309-Pleurochrysis_carterae.AAC.1
MHASATPLRCISRCTPIIALHAADTRGRAPSSPRAARVVLACGRQRCSGWCVRACVNASERACVLACVRARACRKQGSRFDAWG